MAGRVGTRQFRWWDGSRAIENTIMPLPMTATASLPAAATANAGFIVYDSTTTTCKYSNGSSWTAFATAATGDADSIYNAGAWTVTVDANDVNFTATSTAYNFLWKVNVTGTTAVACEIDAYHATAVITDALKFTCTGATAVITDAIDASDAKIVNALTAGANNLSGTYWSITGSTGAGIFVGLDYGTGALVGTCDIAINTSMFTVAGTTGNTVVAGNLSVGGNFSLSGTLTLDAIAAATTNATLTVDGNGVGGVDICSLSSGGVTLSDDTTVIASKTLTITGVAASNVFTITAGDMVISDGSITITDADDAASLKITNNALAAGSLIDIDTTGTVTGKIIDILADNVTTGTMVYLRSSAASFAGKYIQCYDGAADDFSIGLYGATIIAGNADGTDALTLTAGDIKLTDGGLTLSSGGVDVTSNAAHDAFDIIPAADGAALDINLAGSSNLATGYIDIDGSTGSGTVVDVDFSGAYTGAVLDINMTNAVGASIANFTGAGTRTAGLIVVTDTPSSVGTFDLNITPVAATATANVFDIDVAGTGNADVISIDFSGAYVGDAINITTTNGGAAVQAIVVDGTTAPAGALCSFSCSGTIAAAGSVATFQSSGQPAAACAGAAARFLETGAARATSYAVQIDSTSNEALNVSTGKSHFVEAISVLASPNLTIAPNYIQAGGAANAITAALTDDTGTNIALTDGLRLQIDLNTKTLQAGANTLDFNGGGAVAILSHNNPANNIATAYAANGFIDLVYSSTTPGWLDMSQ